MILKSLTKLETEILRDRLELCDCLEDVFCSEAGNEMYHVDDLEAVCDALLRGDEAKANDHSEEITREVLIECVEGSTYYASHEYGVTPQKLAAIARAGDSLARKIGEHYDVPVDFPVW